MLFFKQDKPKLLNILILSQVFCLFGLMLDAWINWHYQLSPFHKDSLLTVSLESPEKYLNLAKVRRNLLRLVELLPAQIKIQKILFLAEELRLVGVSEKAQSFTDFCAGLKEVVGLEKFQILNWQEQGLGIKKNYRFVMVWR